MGRGTGANLLYGEAPVAHARRSAPASFEDLHTRFAPIVPALRHAREKGLDSFKAGFVVRYLGNGIGAAEAEQMLEDLVVVGAVTRSRHRCCARTGNAVGIDSGSNRFECRACEREHAADELFIETRYKVLVDQT